MSEKDAAQPPATLEDLVARATEGDRDALETVIVSIRDDMYRLALRFLWHPQDAEDATQEILVRIVTGLGSFRGQSRFRTWAYRVACNTLISLRKKGRMERVALSFDDFAEDLDRGLSESRGGEIGDPERALLLEEVKIGCTLGMLLCLDREHRLAYIVGEILEMDHHEAAEALGIPPATFRKRLSRARQGIMNLMMSRCGLVNPANSCRCARRVETACALGRVNPDRLLFASSLEQARRFPAVLGVIRQLDAARRAGALQRSHGLPSAPGSLSSWLEGVLPRDLSPQRRS